MLSVLMQNIWEVSYQSNWKKNWAFVFSPFKLHNDPLSLPYYVHSTLTSTHFHPDVIKYEQVAVLEGHPVSYSFGMGKFRSRVYAMPLFFFHFLLCLFFCIFLWHSSYVNVCIIFLRKTKNLHLCLFWIVMHAYIWRYNPIIIHVLYFHSFFACKVCDFLCM